MKKKGLLLLNILVVFSLIVCIKVASAQEPFVIGLNVTLSGGGAAYGNSYKNGTEMAVEEINKAGGIKGVPLKLLVDDNKLSPSEAVLIAKKTFPNVHASIVGISGSCVLAVLPVAAESHVPVFGPGIATIQVTEQGSKWVFRTHFNDRVGAIAFVDYLVKNLKLKRIAIANEDRDYGMGGAISVKEALAKLNLKPVAEERFSTGMIDFTPIVARLKNANPEAIAIWGYYAETSILVKQAKEAGLNVPMGGANAFDSSVFPKLAGPASDNIIFVNPYFPDPNDSKIQNFINRYEQKYGGKPDVYVVNCYDSVYIIAEAMKKAGKNKDNIRDAVRAIKFRGINQELTFDENGDNLRPIHIVEWKDGKQRKLLTTDVKEIVKTIKK
jgi:branched-chain amino acid transport system substrate-binding protein